jgi:CDP-paratose 2-epimerase
VSVALVTGAAGLVGSETSKRFSAEGLEVVGIDNDMRRMFFGESASTLPTRRRLEADLPRYQHRDLDIRDADGINRLFDRFGRDISVVVHTAAQPSHDWAARDPLTDHGINATGTCNLLEATRCFCPNAVFIFTSTNKVYGDTPNHLPLVERDTRWELPADHALFSGIDEGMSIDQSMHSLFGVSKVAADLMVQEYGRYFGMKTAVFRGGCLTGPAHAGAELHGFLAYLMRCAAAGTPYRVFGYKGKQVRDNIHSHDLVGAFWAFFRDPGIAKVYNMGGGRDANCSVLEAISMSEQITGRQLDWTYVDQNRAGDHIWWISNVGRFQREYPDWKCHYDIRAALGEIHDALLATRD